MIDVYKPCLPWSQIPGSFRTQAYRFQPNEKCQYFNRFAEISLLLSFTGKPLIWISTILTTTICGTDQPSEKKHWLLYSCRHSHLLLLFCTLVLLLTTTLIFLALLLFLTTLLFLLLLLLLLFVPTRRCGVSRAEASPTVRWASLGGNQVVASRMENWEERRYLIWSEWFPPLIELPWPRGQQAQPIWLQGWEPGWLGEPS